ncbi:hypothetical protein QBC38DRAFT_483483 [Podospora fimiseda]|uniref:Carboxymethylenebutenolidase n=1 Tax=Podospora fimiseda TaxID=252190 RepID=A0AAN7BL60_9PEZI|nr:hypothetical protein QBC38DRAFT_483483 [Podospora fimiseda]
MALLVGNKTPVDISARLSIQPPLSRRGSGPGLILVISIEAGVDALQPSASSLDPPPRQKWAEEGYAVAQVVQSVNTPGEVGQDIALAIDKLKELKECDGKGFVLVAIGENSQFGTTILNIAEVEDDIKAVVFYGSSPTRYSNFPILSHLPASGQNDSVLKSLEGVITHKYPSTSSGYFVLPSHPDFRASAASVSHTRSLSFLKPLLNGPYFDLEAIWEEHCHYEFGDRSVEETMATMVQEPYVNHVPTLTGGIGRANLTRFYRDHFIFSNPDDTKLELVSRTVGIDRVVDEFLFECTHLRTIDWLIPGIPPTGKKISVPMTSIVNIRGDRLYHEHIAWDQGTVLRQLGLLPEWLPFPYQEGCEYRVPVAGIETAKKMVDENSVASNEMLGYQVRKRN